MNEEELLKAVGFESIDAFDDIAVENPRELLKKFGSYVSSVQVSEVKETSPAPSVETDAGLKSVESELRSEIVELRKQVEGKSMISDSQVKGGASGVDAGERQGFGTSEPVSVIEKLLAHNKREFKESDVFSSGI